jgi:protein SCO1/2
MLRTALLACLLALAGYASAAWLTHDFQVWTAEGARRLEVAQYPVPMPPVTVEGPGIAAQSLPTLLAQGGGVTLVDFVYTRCQTVCLSLGGSFQQLQTALQADRAAGTQSNVRLLSISLDGAYDTPTVLQAYAHKLQADLALWQWVRVPDGAQQKALLQRLGVVVVPDGRGDFEHNAALLVLDAQGRLVRIFDLAEQQLALDYARHLAKGGRL